MAKRGERGQQRDKPFRDALRMEIADANGDFKRLRQVAAALVTKAETGDVPAIKEVADRLDGKVPQAIIGDSEFPGILIEEVRRVIVNPSDDSANTNG